MLTYNERIFSKRIDCAEEHEMKECIGYKSSRKVIENDVTGLFTNYC